MSHPSIAALADRYAAAWHSHDSDDVDAIAIQQQIAAVGAAA